MQLLARGEMTVFGAIVLFGIISVMSVWLIHLLKQVREEEND